MHKCNEIFKLLKEHLCEYDKQGELENLINQLALNVDEDNFKKTYLRKFEEFEYEIKIRRVDYESS